MATAYKGGIGVGATVGVACGLGMDLAAGGMPFYSMAFALSGVMCGVFHRQGRLAAALAYVLSNALAVLWTWSEGLHLSLLYEVFIASVVFLVLPERALRQVGALVAQERARAYVRARMEATAAAFKSLYESMRSAFHPAAPNDNDAASVFDRAAGRICKRCPLQTACWQRDYVSTFNALNDALRTLRVLRLFRTLRAFKLIRYSKSTSAIAAVFEKQREALLAVLCLAIGYILVSALVIFNVEPDTFNTFFDAVYWAVVSLTTVGYGDLYPSSDVGRTIAMISSLMGVAVVALPSGIITAGLLDELRGEAGADD